MPSISSAGVTAALPFLSVHGHAHRKGAPVPAASGTDALTGAACSADASAPATNQGIFSSLLQTAEKLVGVQLTAPTAVPTKSPVSAGTPGLPVASTTVATVAAPVDPTAANDKAAVLKPGLAQALARLQLLNNPGQASAAQTTALRRIDTTA